jgi:hypothetical protein
MHPRAFGLTEDRFESRPSPPPTRPFFDLNSQRSPNLKLSKVFLTKSAVVEHRVKMRFHYAAGSTCWLKSQCLMVMVSFSEGYYTVPLQRPVLSSMLKRPVAIYNVRC